VKRKERERRVVSVVPVKNASGTWDVLTERLLNTVGSSLGPSNNLTLEEAKDLSKRWMDCQRAQDAHEKTLKAAPANRNLRQWDATQSSSASEGPSQLS
jgi:hypothetical protein